MAYDYVQEQNLESQVSYAEGELADARFREDSWQATADDLSASVDAKQAALDAAQTYYAERISPLLTKDNNLRAKLLGLGGAVASGLDASELGRGVQSYISDNVGTISSASSACQRLITRLESELGSLQGQLSSARASLEAASDRVSALDDGLSELRGQLSNARGGGPG